MGNGSNTIKIAIIGDETVGKLSLANRLFENPFGQEIRNRSSLGVEFGSQIILLGGKTYRFHVFVIAGGGDTSLLRKKHYIGACTFFLMYDVSCPKTMENITMYLQEIKEGVKNGKTPLLYIVGNKIDLRSSNKQCISKETMMSFIERLNKQNYLDFSYNEISCKTGENIEQLRSDFHKSLIFSLALGQI